MADLRITFHTEQEDSTDVYPDGALHIATADLKLWLARLADPSDPLLRVCVEPVTAEPDGGDR